MTILEWLLGSPNPQIDSEYSDASLDERDATFEWDQDELVEVSNDADALGERHT